MSEQIEDLPCRDIVEVVTAYLEDELPADLRRRFEYHLTTCRHCVEYVEQMRRTIAAAGQALPPEQLPAALRDGLRRAFGDWAQLRTEP